MRPQHDTVPGARIVAFGHHQPSRAVDNAEIAARVETSDEWIRERTGIVSRRIAGPEETVLDMATAAAGKALAASGLGAADIDLVVVATVSTQTPLPNVAAGVCARLGLAAPAAMDLNTACSGFVHGLAVANHAVLAGSARHALVIGVDKLSDFTDWDDRTTCILFADGAGAAVVSAADEPGIGPVVWGSDGPKGASLTVVPRDVDPNGKIVQDGRLVFRWATTEMVPVALEACRRAGVAPTELAAFVPHQANLRIIEVLARKLGAPDAIVARDIAESGNTSAASIPLALSKMAERGDLPSGVPVLLLGFGGGLTYAGQVVTSP
jgi:3-oxoacyl-[acyl-carrier-protein] synthase-3